MEGVFEPNKYFQSHKKQLQVDALSACDINMSVVELISLYQTITRSEIVCCGREYNDDTQKKRGCAYCPRTQHVCWDCETGILQIFTPKDSFWYQFYFSNPPTTTKKLIRRFTGGFVCPTSHIKKSWGSKIA